MEIARSGRGMQASMNITPFIDVLLVLLVIFMLSTHMREVVTGQLARENGSSRASRGIVLELTNDGRYLLNTREIPHEQLAVTLRDVFAPRPDKVLFIKSGGQRTYQEMITAIDVARGAGVRVVGLIP